MRTSVAAVAVFALVGLAGAADEKAKIDAKKLIGRWEPVEAKKGAEMVLEFKEKGVLALSVTIADKTQTVDGTYKLDGSTLDVEMNFGPGGARKDTMTVTKLTESELVTKDSKGKEETFKRAKDKK